MDVKKLYDDLMAARAAKNQLANQIIALENENKHNEVVDGKLTEKLEAANANVKDLERTYNSLLAATDGNDASRRFVPAGNPEGSEPKEVKALRASSHYRDLWIEALQRGVSPRDITKGNANAEHFGPLMDAISETGGSPVGSEGGFLNPVDFDNKLIELKRQFLDMADYVNMVPVVAYSGWRVIETAVAAQPFESLVELEEVTDDDETESPTFKRIDYTVEDKGGFTWMSNDQLNDTPVNLMAFIARWFTMKLVLTDNVAIQAIISRLHPTVPGKKTFLDDIKNILNTKLDPVISASGSIFTNQTGFDLLDQEKDEIGRPLLQPDPTNAALYRVKNRPVVQLADRLWANYEGESPFAIGSGMEFITLFRRQAFEFASTTIGGKAWRRNATEIRGIVRQVAKEVDSGAMVLYNASTEGS